MKKLNDLTVFLISSGENPNYNLCLTALKNQTIEFELNIIKDYSPLSAAFQEMLNRCKTSYYIECDEDMILKSDTIEKMYNVIVNSSDKISVCCFKLNDVHLNYPIVGIKIYKYDIFKKYPYNLEHKSCEVEQLDRIKKDGYKILYCSDVVGDHSPKWTSDLIFERYFNLMEKYKEYKYGWLKDIPKKLFDLVLNNPTKENIYALLGAYTSIINENKLLDSEKNFKYKRKELLITEKNFEEDKKSSVYIKENRKLNIMKVIDQWGWSYDFLDREYQKYSRHNIIIRKYNEKTDLNNVDLIYIHGPNVSQEISTNLPFIAQEKHVKIVGGYGGLVSSKYSNCIDAICCISPQTYDFARENYSCPVIFLTEFIDSDYFTFEHEYTKRFVVGFAGSINNNLKRTYLLDKLKYPVLKKGDWGGEYFKPGRSLEPMKEFYKSIDVLVICSSSECMSRVILEAMCCGVPVISTDVGMIRVLIGSNWIVPAFPEEKVVEIINRKLDDLNINNINLRRYIAQINRKRIEKYFSWKTGAPYCDDIFECIYNDEYDKAQEISKKFGRDIDCYRKYPFLARAKTDKIVTSSSIPVPIPSSVSPHDSISVHNLIMKTPPNHPIYPHS